jgi:chromosome segregation ATPase
VAIELDDVTRDAVAACEKLSQDVKQVADIYATLETSIQEAQQVLEADAQKVLASGKALMEDLKTRATEMETQKQEVHTNQEALKQKVETVQTESQTAVKATQEKHTEVTQAVQGHEQTTKQTLEQANAKGHEVEKQAGDQQAALTKIFEEAVSHLGQIGDAIQTMVTKNQQKSQEVANQVDAHQTQMDDAHQQAGTKIQEATTTAHDHAQQQVQEHKAGVAETMKDTEDGFTTSLEAIDEHVKEAMADIQKLQNTFTESGTHITEAQSTLQTAADEAHSDGAASETPLQDAAGDFGKMTFA